MTIAIIQWVWADPVKQRNWTGNEVQKIYNLGYFWWMYGEFAGPLQYIRFLKQNFFAPDKQLDGYAWCIKPDVKGQFFKVYTKLDTNPIRIIDKAISFRYGNLSGLSQIGLEGFEGTDPVITKMAENKRLITTSK